MMARQRNHRSSGRKSSYSTIVFAVLIIFTFVILFLLVLGILSVPSNNAASSEANDLTSIVRKSLQRYDNYPDSMVTLTVLRSPDIIFWGFSFSAEVARMIHRTSVGLKSSLGNQELLFTTISW